MTLAQIVLLDQEHGQMQAEAERAAEQRSPRGTR